MVTNVKDRERSARLIQLSMVGGVAIGGAQLMTCGP